MTGTRSWSTSGSYVGACSRVKLIAFLFRRRSGPHLANKKEELSEYIIHQTERILAMPFLLEGAISYDFDMIPHFAQRRSAPVRLRWRASSYPCKNADIT